MRTQNSEGRTAPGERNRPGPSDAHAGLGLQGTPSRRARKRDARRTGPAQLQPWPGSRAGARATIVERVQTGVRLEKRLLKVLRALADYHDLTLGDLLEGIVLHAFEGKPPFGPASRKRIAALKTFYGLDLDAGASHQLVEGPTPGGDHVRVRR